MHIHALLAVRSLVPVFYAVAEMFWQFFNIFFKSRQSFEVIWHLYLYANIIKCNKFMGLNEWKFNYLSYNMWQ